MNKIKLEDKLEVVRVITKNSGLTSDEKAEAFEMYESIYKGFPSLKHVTGDEYVFRMQERNRVCLEMVFDKFPHAERYGL